MSLSKLASGRWGAQVHDPATGRNVRVSKILGDAYVTNAGAIGSRSFRTKSEAKRRAKTPALACRRRGAG